MINTSNISEKDDGTFLIQLTSSNPILKDCLFIYDNLAITEDYSHYPCDSYIIYQYTDVAGNETAMPIEDVDSKYISIEVLQEAIRMRDKLITHQIEEILDDMSDIEESLL